MNLFVMAVLTQALLLLLLLLLCEVVAVVVVVAAVAVVLAARACFAVVPVATADGTVERGEAEG